ncbi:MAG: signal recognition particle-docking protein FtsY [Gammaproteobacteria bacterium]|nr:signal recognition particle-docking protein FtsY [Gammaproteobacteria bacterium]
MKQKQGIFGFLAKTRESLSNSLSGLLSRAGPITDLVFEELEDHLIMADFGVYTAQEIVRHLRKSAKREKIDSIAGLNALLQLALLDILSNPNDDVQDRNDTEKPQVILMVGVNGVGKTTTLAKLANYYKGNGYSVIMAAGDTFRAAAIEQLQTWGQRLEVPVVAQSLGSDAAAVAYDAMNSAYARNIDYLLIDSAGRQHTHGDLMDQLQKMKRVIGKIDESAPHQILITVDATNGQNVLSQVENFQKTLLLTGICVTKLDGTAKGGVVVALANQFQLPVKFIGVGEGIDDLSEFSAQDFAAALIPDMDIAESR